jgi:hypothetical protein
MHVGAASGAASGTPSATATPRSAGATLLNPLGSIGGAQQQQQQLLSSMSGWGSSAGGGAGAGMRRSGSGLRSGALTPRSSVGGQQADQRLQPALSSQASQQLAHALLQPGVLRLRPYASRTEENLHMLAVSERGMGGGGLCACVWRGDVWGAQAVDIAPLVQRGRKAKRPGW